MVPVKCIEVAVLMIFPMIAEFHTGTVILLLAVLII
jgi:hypothetical protein